MRLEPGAFAAEGELSAPGATTPDRTGTDGGCPAGSRSVRKVQLIVDHIRRDQPELRQSYAYFNLFRAMTTFSKYRGPFSTPHADQLQTLYSKGYLPDCATLYRRAFRRCYSTVNSMYRARCEGRETARESTCTDVSRAIETRPGAEERELGFTYCRATYEVLGKLINLSSVCS